MDYAITAFGHERRIALSGQFTFSDNVKFRKLIALLEEHGLQAMNLDFSQVEFIDSAALGMLLLLRDECIMRKIRIAIHSPRGQVQKIFALSKFDQLFSIH